MVLFKVALVSYIGLTNHLLHTISERQLKEQEVIEIDPTIVDGRRRLSSTELLSLKAWSGGSFAGMVWNRLVFRVVTEKWTPFKYEFCKPPETILMSDVKKMMKKPLSTSVTEGVVLVGGGLALLWAIKMLISWFTGGRNRHHQGPSSQHFPPLVPSWPVQRTMSAGTLRALLQDTYATVVTLERLLQALNLNALVPSFGDYKLSTLLTSTYEDVRVRTAISQDQWETIFNNAQYLQTLSTHLLKID